MLDLACTESNLPQCTTAITANSIFNRQQHHG